MDDKERLEEIEKDIFINRKSDMTKLLHGDALWLIQQAKRVEELEKENKQIKTAYDDRLLDIDMINDEKERYKQALEFYADKKNWSKPSRQQVMIDGEPDIVEGPPRAIEDGGEKARQALEGETNVP